MRPFSILVLGDFSGRAVGEASEPASDWRPVRVTPDNMPELAGVAPTLRLHPLGGPPVELRLERLDDFHPDALFRGLPLFGELREERAGLERGQASSVRGQASSARPRAEPPVDGPGLLDAVVREADPGRGSPSGRGEGTSDAELREFVRRVVDPHRVRTTDRSEELAAIDRAAGELMRGVLHDDAFRALEALWRSVVFLLSRIDTTGKVRVHLVDVGRGELARDLIQEEDLARSRLYGLLAEPDPEPGGGRWALAVGAYTFGRRPEDAALLGLAAEVARAADVPWLSGADPRLAGCPSLETAPDPRDWDEPWPGEWAAVRSASSAAWVGLALPRLLVREPYGSEWGRSCRSFSFREEPEVADATSARPLLWGNGAFVCAAVLARAFVRRGWGSPGGGGLDLAPVPVAEGGAAEGGPPGGGAAGARPVVTEGVLRPTAVERLAESGFIPLVAFPREARVRVGGFRSVAEPAARLAGWWCGGGTGPVP